MTCRDCVHYEVCDKYNNVFERELSERYCAECDDFKPKSSFVELPCKCELYLAVSALADMVYQFGYETTFRKQEAVIDGGLSALENAFGALYYLGCKFTSNGKIIRKNLLEFQERMKVKAENALKEREK